MRTITTDVNHKGRKVGSVDIPVYESIEELLDAESPEMILAMFNKANKIRIQGNERAKHTDARVGKQRRRALAYKLISTEELANYAGDFMALQAFLDSPEIQARVDQAIEKGELD